MVFPEGVVTRLLDTLNGVVRGLLSFTPAGAGLAIAEGANARMGVSAAMVGGTLLVANTSITATTRIFLVHLGTGVVANFGHLYVSARVAGASFTVTSSNGLDTDTFGYLLVEPA